jgi:DNA-binding transcriptional regulator YdaS (Cro superfamily)
MKLSAYLSSVGKSRSAFAAELETSRQNVARWCEGVTPRRQDMLRILAATEGKVTANDFMLAPAIKPPPAKPNSEKAA